MASQDRLNQIVETALAILQEQGLEDLHARSIASRMKVNHATVHYYFKTRPLLLAGVFDHAIAAFLKARTDELSTFKPAQLLRADIRFFTKPNPFWKIWPNVVVAAQADPAIQEKKVNFENQLLAEITDSINKSREAGTKVQKGALRNPKVLAGTLIGLCQMAASIEAFQAVEEELLG